MMSKKGMEKNSRQRKYDFDQVHLNLEGCRLLASRYLYPLIIERPTLKPGALLNLGLLFYGQTKFASPNC